MARPTFTPDDDQRRILAALTRLARRRAKLDAEADTAIAEADRKGIPINHIADALAVQRKTIYRHLGRPMK